MLLRGAAMDFGVPLTGGEAAALSRLVEVYIGLRMCTCIRAISEQMLLHCSLPSAREKGTAAMYDAMQDDVTKILHLATFIALLLDGSGRQRDRINEYAILLVFLGTALGGMCEVFLGIMDVVCGDAQEITKHLECVLQSRIPYGDWWTQRVGDLCSGRGF